MFFIHFHYPFPPPIFTYSYKYQQLQKGGEEVQLELLPNLKISVALGTAKPEKYYERSSIYERYEVKHSITLGYTGGFQNGEIYKSRSLARITEFHKLSARIIAAGF